MASLPLQRHVLLHDLVSSAHLNGLVGFCEKLDEKSGRLAVRMPSAVANAKAPILLQPKNVSRLGDVVNDISSACEAEHADEVRDRVAAAHRGDRDGGGKLLLDLEHVGLKELPVSVAAIDALEELWLGGNRLRVLPVALGSLCRLVSLDVDGNQLSVLPESLGMLGCLTSLYANDNQLVELPAALGELPRLRELRLSDNQLSPDALCPLARLPSLSVLWLARNGLSEVPGPLCALRALTELDLDANAISTLPADLLRSSTLTTISVDHNPLEFPPADVVARGLDAMRGWLRQRVEPAIPAPTPAFQPQYAHEPAGSVHTPIAQSPLSDAEGWDGSFVFPASR